MPDANVIGGEFIQDRECLVGAAPPAMILEIRRRSGTHGVQVRGGTWAFPNRRMSHPCADDGELGVRGIGLSARAGGSRGGPESAGAATV